MWQMKLYGELEPSWAILTSIDLLSESEFVLTENDIESYNWPDQSITLTSEISAKLIETYLPKEEYSAKKIYLEQNLGAKVFLVVLEEKKLYGGIFINRISAMGALYPVIYPFIAAVTQIEPPELQIRLVVRPRGTFGDFIDGYYKLDSSIKSRIEIQKVHDFFQKLGKLTHNDSSRRVKPWLPEIEPILKLK